MKRRFILVLVLLAIIPQAKSESLLPCSDVFVQYSAPTLISLQDRVQVIAQETRPADVLPESDTEFTAHAPQRTAAFNRLLIADPSQLGPRDNVVEVFTLSGPIYTWHIRIHDLLDNARLQWINDDLLFIQIWWGRIVSTDLIFQISTGKFVYSQEANYGALVQPCE